MNFVIFVSSVLVFSYVSSQNVTQENPPPNCLVGEAQLYDPKTLKNIPTFNVSLDEKPNKRWNHVVVNYADKMKTTIKLVKSMMSGYFQNSSSLDPEQIWGIFMIIMNVGYEKLQEPYKSELWGISQTAKIPIGELFAMSLFYEIGSACTSIVAQDPTGHVYHGRNLDIDNFFGGNLYTNSSVHQSSFVDNLKDLSISVNFIKSGKILYKGATYAGHTGILTGLKPGGFSVSINERTMGGFDQLIDFFINGPKGRDQVTYALRDVMSKANSFNAAIKYFEHVPLYVGGYFIVGGVNNNEGAIVTRSFNKTDMLQAINNITTPDNFEQNYYVLQTNYDWNQPDESDDQRTIPGRKCMNKLTQQNVGFPGLFQVLSSHPTLNKGTVHTSLMDVKKGILETYIQTCQNC